jgi:phosphoserine phosphatase
MKLTLFDLDHTVLNGDSDVLWCDFLIEKGILGKTEFTARNADMAARYRAGTVGLKEFADFYVGTLAGRTAEEWEPLRQEFLADWIVPRVTPAALALVDKHLEAGDLVVMTTATNRFITELTAIYFDIEHLIATEPEMRGSCSPAAPPACSTCAKARSSACMPGSRRAACISRTARQRPTATRSTTCRCWKP